MSDAAVHVADVIEQFTHGILDGVGFQSAGILSLLIAYDTDAVLNDGHLKVGAHDEWVAIEMYRSGVLTVNDYML